MPSNRPRFPVVLENVKIRRASEADLQQIVKLSEKLGRDESAMDSMVSPLPSEFQNPNWILKNIKGENAAVFVAEADGKVVGYSLGWISQPWSYKAKRGYICDCFVEKAYRRRGIGKTLVKAMLEWFRNKGVECVEADIYSNNIPSLAMFKGLGFKEVSKRLRLIFESRQ
ncbi:MAG: GNAT family N-acetyltransferase [Candidatus Bathyarchaeota archaeon]|nr:GNAT family N-acetyltransferase [Candidatus Bathyarchaeota archaeon]MDW8040001.1 GNAT family N-acetyltransferase [Nitrososphaerota archaeon]